MRLHYLTGTLRRLVAVALVLAAVLMVMVAFASLEGRRDQSDARAPRYASEQDATLAYRQDATAIGQTDVSIMYLEPLEDGVATPAGLDEWPGPGEVAISPGLEPYVPEIVEQFGEVTARIAPDALLSEEELIVYIRPLDHKRFIEAARSEEGVYFASGFGDQDGLTFGDAAYEYQTYLLFVLIAFMIFPVSVGYYWQVRSSSRTNINNQIWILEAIGATPRVVAATKLRAFGPPILLAYLAALITIALLSVVPVTLPFNGFVLKPAHIRPFAWALVQGVSAVTVVVLGTFIFPARSIRVIRRKGKRRRSRSFWLVLLVIVGIATFYVGVEKIRDPLAGDTGLLLMALGVLVTVIAIPATVALTVKGLCAALARFKWFSPLSTVVLTAAGRYSMQVSRLGALFGTFVIAGSLIATIYISSSTLAHASFDYADVEGKAVGVESSCTEIPIGTCPTLMAQQVLERTDHDTLVLAQIDSSAGTADKYVLQGNLPQAIEEPGARDVIMDFLGGELATVQSVPVDLEDLPDGRISLLVYNRSGGLDLSSFYRLTDTESNIAPTVQWYGERDFAASAIFAHHSRWVTWLGAIGFIIAGCTLTEIATRRLQTEARLLAPLVALGGRAQFVAAATRPRSAVITTASLVITIVVALGLNLPLATAQRTPLPVGYLAMLTVVFIGLQAVQQGLVEHTLRRHAEYWHPGRGI